MKKLLSFLPDLFLHVLKSLSVQLYYHLRSVRIYFFFFLLYFSSREEFGWFASFLDAKAQIIFRHAMLHLTVLRNEENEAVYNKPTGNESWRFTHHSFFSLPSFFPFPLSLSLSLFLSSLPFPSSLSLPPLLVLPSRVPSVSRSTPTCLMEFRRMPHALTPSFFFRVPFAGIRSRAETPTVLRFEY